MIRRCSCLTIVMALGLISFLATGCGQAPSLPTATPTLVPPTATPTPTSTPIRTPTIEPTPLATDNWIAFTSDRDGNQEIYKMRADGSQVTNLTNNPADDWAPSWSPDGKWIAFTSDRDEHADIYYMRADGGRVARLTPGTFSYDESSWSPDGNWIAFSCSGGLPWEIYKMRPDGPEFTRLTDNHAEDQGPSWSPDGNWIAFASDRDGNWEIYKMRADGSQVTRLTDDPATDCFSSWSPDGDWIAFASDRDGYWEIYKMGVDGSQVANLTNSPACEDAFPSWSPDADWIAFVSGCGESLEIYKMRADGTQVIRLTDNPGDDFQPSWGSSPKAVEGIPTAVAPTATPTAVLTPMPGVTPTVAMALYESAQYPFSIQYPAQWAEQPKSPDITVLFAEDSVFFGIAEDDFGAIAEEERTLEAYVDFVLGVLAATLDQFEVVSRQRTVNAQGLPVQIVTLTAGPGGGTELSRIFYLHENKIGFSATYYGPKGRMEELEPVIEFSFSTFQVKD